MLDLGWAELLLVGVVALIVIGPKDLPSALRTVTGFVRQARGMAREFQRGIEDIAKDSGIQDIKKELTDTVGLGLDDDLKLDKDIKDALSAKLDDEPKKIGGKSSKGVVPTGSKENSIAEPPRNKMASKPPATPAPDDAGPEETPKPDIVSADTTEPTDGNKKAPEEAKPQV